MYQSGFTGRLAGVSARHPWRVITAWALILAAAIWLAGGLGDQLSQDGELTVCRAGTCRITECNIRRITYDLPGRKVNCGTLTHGWGLLVRGIRREYTRT